MMNAEEIKLNRVLHGKNQDVLKDFPANFFDSVITDPPYELGFMSKAWDASGVAYNVAMWKEVLRVAKPGATLFCFGGTRTYHRVACAIEDAGWQLKDSLMWIYGSGFPKSLDIGKQLDKLDAVGLRRKRNLIFTKWMRSTGISCSQINWLTDSQMGSHYLTDLLQPSIATLDMFDKIKHLLPEPPDDIMQMMIDRTVESKNFADREVIGKSKWDNSANHFVPGMNHKERVNLDITEPATDIAKQWNGYGTALKPAFEPIILAQKPLEKGLTYAQNARKWGVAGLNIDAGRISTSDNVGARSRTDTESGSTNMLGVNKSVSFQRSEVVKGRWPANVILSHSPDCVQVGTQQIKGNQRPNSDGTTHEAVGSQIHAYGYKSKSYNLVACDENGQEMIDVYACVPNCPIRIMDTQSGKLHARGNVTAKDGQGSMFGGSGQHTVERGFAGDSGGASRFFYTAKASRSERESGLKDFVPCVKCGEFGTDTHTVDADGNYDPKATKNNCIRNNHPTVKPVSIMKYLCELIRMPDNPKSPQVILDPFCGSGTTLLAADEVGLKYIGIDMGIDNVLIASSRSIDTPPNDYEPAATQTQDPIDIASSAAQLSPSDFDDLIL